MAAKCDEVYLRWFGQSCLHFGRADEADPALRREPAATKGELKRCDPPDKKDLSIGDSAVGKGSDESSEYDAPMSPKDLSGPIPRSEDTKKERGWGSNLGTKSMWVEWGLGRRPCPRIMRNSEVKWPEFAGC
jgi:hypothetical protein